MSGLNSSGLNWERVPRNDPDYKACATVTTAGGAIVGGMTGSFLGPAGTFAGYAGGAAWGLAAGYFLCPYLVPVLKHKLENGLDLTDAEVRSAGDAMATYASVDNTADALKLLRVVRRTGLPRGPAAACTDPASTAQMLLRHA